MATDNSAEHAKRMEKLTQLIDLLYDHPAMTPVKDSFPSTPNRPDGRMVPSVQNSVYFMWDFTIKTKMMLEQVEPSMDAKKTSPKISQKQLNELWGDVLSRSWLSKSLICDTPDQLSMMCGDTGAPPDFGDAIRNLAKELSENKLT